MAAATWSKFSPIVSNRRIPLLADTGWSGLRTAGLPSYFALEVGNGLRSANCRWCQYG